MFVVSRQAVYEVIWWREFRRVVFRSFVVFTRVKSDAAVKLLRDATLFAALVRPAAPVEIGRAACRARVQISVVAVSFKKKKSVCSVAAATRHMKAANRRPVASVATLS